MSRRSLQLCSIYEGTAVRVSEGVNHDGEVDGVVIELVSANGIETLNFEKLTRLDALRMALYQAELAIMGLDVDDAIELYRRAGQSFIEAGMIAPDPDFARQNIFPFPASSGIQPPKTVSEEDPAGGTPVHPVPPAGIVEQLTVDSGQLTADTPPAPPQAGGKASETPAL